LLFHDSFRPLRGQHCSSHSPEILWKQVIRHDKHRMYSHFRPYVSEKAHNFTKRTTTCVSFATYSSCPPAYPTPASLPSILIKRKKEFGTDLESGSNLRSCISTWKKMTQRCFSKFWRWCNDMATDPIEKRENYISKQL
jgi:hypothetical protein